jgi:hypothetical protein
MATSSRETARESATDRVFDYFLERQTALFEAIRASTDRTNRFNNSLIDGARQSSQDWVEVGRRWLDKPSDLISLWEGASEAWGNAQQRNLSLVREFIENSVEMQRENSEAIRRGIGDVREVVERAQANAPQFLRRGWRRAENGAEERTAATEA